MHPSVGQPKEAVDLALAVVAVSDAPLILLDSGFHVTAASASFCGAYGIDPTKVDGRQLFELGDGEWESPKLRSLLKGAAFSNAPINAYDMDLKRAGQPARRLTVKTRRLKAAAGEETRLLLTILDVTDARASDRAKDELVRENALLLQEVQHRIANSLQIIASVLLQSARKVQSDESRAHLHDAHHRVMSVAAVQRHLAASKLGDVELRPYFTELCSSLANSMIADHSKIHIEVVADNAVVPADVSVSLGLIITELVINALKHAFPVAGEGTIVVGYQSRGPNWSLIVKDDGVGMPTGAKLKVGLGSGIVQALANQLGAKIRTTNRKPGTAITLVHNQIAIVQDEGRSGIFVERR